MIFTIYQVLIREFFSSSLFGCIYFFWLMVAFTYLDWWLHLLIFIWIPFPYIHYLFLTSITYINLLMLTKKLFSQLAFTCANIKRKPYKKL
jgi:ABC-type cobalamin transport system permease subunit